MLKLLHTSDWHLGQTLYNYNRREEHQHFIDQLGEIISTHRPDVLAISGDIFHNSQPSAEWQSFYSEAISRFHTLAPEMIIIATAGNHDSPSRHEVFRKPWEALNVHAIGALDRSNPTTHIIPIGNKGYVVAIPYFYSISQLEDFFAQMAEEVSRLNPGNLPVVLMAHATVTNCDITGHDRHLMYTSIGGLDSISISSFSQEFDYVALGHIHKPQTLRNTGQRLRYSGSPIAVSFDENYSHSVSLVEIESHGKSPAITEIEIINPRPLLSLPAEGFAKWEEIKEMVRQFPADLPAYLRLQVEVTDFLPPHAADDINALLEGKEARFCLFNVTRPHADANHP
ncbi:MAG: exonuclease subunit SbcD [Paramuribaculum sp.]|nr:exonuclease subunit SbcD [Paramuribaculum sp.]